jgi:hypothetical protein
MPRTSYSAPGLWNSLPENLRGAETVDICKGDVKTSFKLSFSLRCFLVVQLLLFFHLLCKYEIFQVLFVV